MSKLEDAIGGGRFVVTAELLTINSGGLDAVRERFEPYEPWVDADNATDNTSAHAHASPVAVAIALKQLGMEPVLQLYEFPFGNQRSLEIFSAKALISSRDFVPAALFTCRRMMIVPFLAMIK